MLKRFAVIGYPLGHTMSPFIHKKLFELSGIEAEYEAILTPPEGLLATVERLKGYDGFNITIPHKETLIPLIDELKKSAQIYKAVNTVKCSGGHLTGYSTDAEGFTSALELRGIPLKGKVLVLGCGGASRTIATECALRGCEVTLAVLKRSVAKAKAIKDDIYERFSRKANYILIDEIKENYDLVVNGTPVGMYPNSDASPLSDSQLKNVSYVFDAVYNPKDTLLVKKARELKKIAVSGMDMLVLQAVSAHKHWYGGRFSKQDILKVIDAANAEMERLFAPKSIILCGFMGSGKTVTGKALAKALGIQFCDLDRYIEEKEGMTVKEIFATKGEKHFRFLETEACRRFGKEKGIVLSLGGGTVINPENVELLRAEGNEIYLLSVSAKTVKDRLKNDTARPLLKDNKEEAIEALLAGRKEAYLKAADHIIDSNGTVAYAKEQILKIYKNKQ